MQNIDLIDRIYTEVYKKVNNQYIDVFLCGGASKKSYTSLRDKLREEMNKINNLRVLYPEDLFIEILNLNKNADLLSLESVLANNCDYICIVAESAGSLVELGAFVNNAKTKDKVIVLINKKNSKDKSFIMLGPVRYLKFNNDAQVIFFGDNVYELLKQVRQSIRELNKVNIGVKSIKDINTIVGMYNLIPIVLYFYIGYDVSELRKSLKNLSTKKGYDEKDFDHIYNASIKLLYKEKLILKVRNEKMTTYKLTNNGYIFSNKILSNLNISNRTMLYDSIRFDIMMEKYY